MLAMALAAIVAITPAAVEFPKVMRGPWGQDLAACEPEFTRGQTIRADRVTYYEGEDRIFDVTPLSAIRTPHGIGLTTIAKLRYRFHDETSTSSERLTVVGKWLYRSGSRDALTKHFTRKNRLVRCPMGSTDG